MVSSTKPFGSPTVKPEHPASSEPITSRDLRAIRRDEQRAQDQPNTATNFGEASTVFDPLSPLRVM